MASLDNQLVYALFLIKVEAVEKIADQGFDRQSTTSSMVKRSAESMAADGLPCSVELQRLVASICQLAIRKGSVGFIGHGSRPALRQSVLQMPPPGTTTLPLYGDWCGSVWASPEEAVVRPEREYQDIWP